RSEKIGISLAHQFQVSENAGWALRRSRRRHSSPRPSIEPLRQALTVVVPPELHCATRAPWLPFRSKQQLHIKGGPPPCYPVVNLQQASAQASPWQRNSRNPHPPNPPRDAASSSMRRSTSGRRTRP